MENPTAERATILVVDDDERNRIPLRVTMEDEGYDVRVAAGGQEALDHFARGGVDCVLLDVRMPGMDGYAVCERIRAAPEGADVPVIFLTAYRDVETFDRAFRAGATDFLTKPVQFVELVLRVQQALKLRRLNVELRAQYEDLRRQRDALYRAQLLREDLATFLVHDLKNPVHSIDLLAQVILRAPAASDHPRDAARRIRTETRDLLRLIHDFLDVTRGEQGRLATERRPVALDALVGELVAAREPQAAERGVTLRAEVQAPSVDADADLLRRVLENLLENALRHAPRGSTVRVSAGPADGAVEIAVADEGSGVPEALRGAIFDRYVQLPDGGGLQRVGRGLGLAFCKLAVEAHGGRLWVEDGRPGAVFRLSLPPGPPKG